LHSLYEKTLELTNSLKSILPFRLKAALSPSLRKRYHSLTEALFNLWGEIGIDSSLEPLNMSIGLEAEHQDIDLIIGGQIADYDDPEAFTYNLFHSKVGISRNYYSSKELDELLENARIESKPIIKEKLYKKVEDFLLENYVVLPLFHEIDYRVASPNIKGLTLSNTPPYVNYSEIGKTSEALTAIRKRGGGVIYIPSDRELTSLDPSLVYSDLQIEIIPNIFETLTRQSEGARIIPWLASDFQSEEGGKKFRFHLRKHIYFHDGRQLTARDVRYSFERVLQNQESQSRLLLSPIQGAKALLNGEKRELEGFNIISAFEFTIELDQLVSFFPSLLAHSSSSIIPENTKEIKDSWRDGSVGTGPFRVLRFNPHHRLELEANPSYWRKGYPKSEGLVFTFGVSQSDILQGFQNGQFSLVGSLLPLGMETLRNNSEFLSGYREIPSFSSFFIAFNIHQGPLADEKLRRKLVQILDINNLIRKNVGRHAIVAHSLIPPGLIGYEKIFHIHTPITQTKVFAQGIELTCAIPPSFLQGAYAKFYNALFNTLSEEGFKVTIVTKTWDDFLKFQDLGSVDLSVTGWIADYPDADAFTYAVLHSKYGNVGRLCGNVEIDSLIEKGRTETDPLVRHSIYREIEESIERHALLLPLFHPQACRFARPEIEEFELTPFPPIVCYDKLWIRW
jgi:ABC-type oligopeptide transport system substrate-binding subunit